MLVYVLFRLSKILPWEFIRKGSQDLEICLCDKYAHLVKSNFMCQSGCLFTFSKSKFMCPVECLSNFNSFFKFILRENTPWNFVKVSLCTLLFFHLQEKLNLWAVVNVFLVWSKWISVSSGITLVNLTLSLVVNVYATLEKLTSSLMVNVNVTLVKLTLSVIVNVYATLVRVSSCGVANMCASLVGISVYVKMVICVSSIRLKFIWCSECLCKSGEIMFLWYYWAFVQR